MRTRSQLDAIEAEIQVRIDTQKIELAQHLIYQCCHGEEKTEAMRFLEKLRIFNHNKFLVVSNNLDKILEK